MTPTPSASRLLCALLLAAATEAPADNLFVNPPEPVGPSNITEAEPWQEGAVRVPPPPQDANLVEFEIDGPASPFRYYIDTQSLAAGADGVVRYTVVVQGRGSARNIAYEGIRCTPKGEYRVYAYGAENRFTPSGETDWLPITSLAHELYRKNLWQHHLCIPREFKPRPRRDMIRSLRGAIAPRENRGFQAD